MFHPIYCCAHQLDQTYTSPNHVYPLWPQDSQLLQLLALAHLVCHYTAFFSFVWCKFPMWLVQVPHVAGASSKHAAGASPSIRSLSLARTCTKTFPRYWNDCFEIPQPVPVAAWSSSTSSRDSSHGPTWATSNHSLSPLVPSNRSRPMSGSWLEPNHMTDFTFESIHATLSFH